jgi:S-adenosylmethionine-dependent methyltransferase
MPNLDRVLAYYEVFDEWSRLETPQGRLELVRALELIDREVAPGSAVLDLGGGPGRYALALTRRGHRVVLADPSAVQLDVARERAREAGLVFPIVEADARSLDGHADGAYDAVLAFGPFYHLIDAVDRERAAAEVARVLRPGGVLLAQIMPRLSGVRGILERASYAPAHVGTGALRRVLHDGNFVNASAQGFPVGWYPHAEEARALFAGAGLVETGFESLRGIACGREAALLALRDPHPDRFAEAMDVLRATARDPAVIALGDYAVWTGRRRDGTRS